MNDLWPFLKHSVDEFQTWLALDLEVREDLYALIGAELPLTVESLDPLEAFLLGRFETIRSALSLEHRAVTEAASRHVGQVFAFNVAGAAWTLSLERPREMYCRLPTIRFEDGWVVAPLTEVTACLDRRTGHFMRDVVAAHIEEYGATAAPKRTGKAKPKKKTR